jgi:anti-anti-sigma factor
MSVEKQTLDGRCVVSVRGALSIWEATATWGSLFALLETPGPLEIDLTAVESCDGAGIQILCQIQRTLAARADQSRITGLSDALGEALRVAGLDADGFAIGRGEA